MKRIEPNNKLMRSDIYKYPSIAPHIEAVNKYAFKKRNKYQLAKVILEKNKQKTIMSPCSSAEDDDFQIIEQAEGV